VAITTPVFVAFASTNSSSAFLIPLLDFNDPADSIEDYLAGLRLLDGVADDVEVFVPGHGSVGDGDQLPERIDLDRT